MTMDVESRVLQPEILSVDELTVLLRQVVLLCVSGVLHYFYFGSNFLTASTEWSSLKTGPVRPGHVKITIR